VADISNVHIIIDSKVREIVRGKKWNGMENTSSANFKGSLVSLDIPDFNVSSEQQQQTVENSPECSPNARAGVIDDDDGMGGGTAGCRQA
jgi:hypothetical protein